jgi:hypothetical protein
MARTDPAGWPHNSVSLQELRRRAERIRRCRALPPLRPGEMEQLVAAFVAKHGAITQCPPAYVVPIQQ